MTAEHIAGRLRGFLGRNAGQVFTVYLRRLAKTRVGTPYTIEKETRIQGQLTEYGHRKPVRAAIAAGTRIEPTLPSHIAESFYVAGIRFWRGHNGKVYLPIVLFNKRNTRVTWYQNGKHVDRAAIESYLLASELGNHSDRDADGQVPFIAVDVSNITDIR